MCNAAIALPSEPGPVAHAAAVSQNSPSNTGVRLFSRLKPQSDLRLPVDKPRSNETDFFIGVYPVHRVRQAKPG